MDHAKMLNRDLFDARRRGKARRLDSKRTVRALEFTLFMLQTLDLVAEPHYLHFSADVQDQPSDDQQRNEDPAKAAPPAPLKYDRSYVTGSGCHIRTTPRLRIVD